MIDPKEAELRSQTLLEELVSFAKGRLKPGEGFVFQVVIPGPGGMGYCNLMSNLKSGQVLDMMDNARSDIEFKLGAPPGKAN